MNIRDLHEVVMELILERELMFQESALTIRRIQSLVTEGFSLEDAYLICCNELNQLEDK